MDLDYVVCIHVIFRDQRQCISLRVCAIPYDDSVP